MIEFKRKLKALTGFFDIYSSKPTAKSFGYSFSILNASSSISVVVESLSYTSFKSSSLVKCEYGSICEAPVNICG